MSKSLNIGCGGSFVWFKLYCDSLENMISDATIHEHAQFLAEFWVREGEQSALEEVLDKANLRNEFTDIVNERHVKHLQYADAQGFVDKIFTALQNYIQE